MEDYIEQIARGEVAVEDPTSGRLNCCEYARARDGKVRNVLQCFCECDAVDESASNLLARGEVPTPSQMRRIEEDIADRIRVPWVRGAVRINPWVLAVPLALCFEALLLYVTNSTVILPCVSFAILLYTSVTFMRYADTARSKLPSTNWKLRRSAGRPRPTSRRRKHWRRSPSGWRRNRRLRHRS